MPNDEVQFSRLLTESPNLELGYITSESSRRSDPSHILGSRKGSIPDNVDDTLLSFADDGRFEDVLELYAKVKDKKRSDLLQEIIKVACHPFKDVGDAASSPFDNNILALSSDDTVSQSFQKVYDELNTSKTGLRACFINASKFTGKNPYERWRKFKYWNAHSGFQTVALSLLMNSWAADWNEQEMIAAMILQPAIRKVTPSQKLQSTYRGAIMRPVHPSRMVQIPDQLKLADWSDSFYLQWQWSRYPPEYRSDMDIYVRQPYRQLPVLDFIRLMVLKQPSHSATLVPRCRKIVVTTNSSRILEGLLGSVFGTHASLKTLPDTDCELVRFFCHLYSLMVNDLLDITHDACSNMDNVDDRRRSSPSSSKMKYLLHLEEWFEEITRSIAASVVTLGCIRSALKQHSSIRDSVLQFYMDELETFTRDFEVLAEDIKSRIVISKKMRALMKDQMDYSNRVRNNMIGILVAIYVPLSFATALYGMNITETTPTQYNTTISTRQGNSWNHTLTTTSTNQPTARTWSFRTVAATAIPLTIGTVLIPIAIGPSYRAVARYSQRNPKSWRNIVSLCGLLAVAGLCIARWKEMAVAVLVHVFVLMPMIVFHVLFASNGQSRNWLIAVRVFWVICLLLNYWSLTVRLYLGITSSGLIGIALVGAWARTGFATRVQMWRMNRERKRKGLSRKTTY